MRKDIFSLIAVATTGVLMRAIFSQMISLAIGKLADPLVRLFYSHAKAYATGLSHKERSPRKCPDCEPLIKGLPN